MINVLALVTFKVFPPQMGGQKGVVLFYQYLKGILNVSMAVSRNNEQPPSGWEVEPLLFDNRKMFLNPFVLGRLKTIIRKKKIDVVIAEHSYAGWLAWLLKKKFQIPFVLHSHNIEALRFRQMNRSWWRFYWHYEKWIHQKADHNFFISADDQQYAIKNFGLKAEKCTVITFGIEPVAHMSITKKDWLQSLGLKGNESIFYFNGTLDYKPNFDAVMVLINHVAPMLQQQMQNFRIIITGNRAPAALKEKLTAHPYFIFLDYVKDVNPFYQMADVFVNPVVNNSGVKTKVIEALAAHCTVVSARSGAAGIDSDLCGQKLLLADDHHWDGFAQLVLQQVKSPRTETPKAFFDSYLWNNIAQKAAEKIGAVAGKHAE